jgi:osmotically-inducible protein OsmY
VGNVKEESQVVGSKSQGARPSRNKLRAGTRRKKMNTTRVLTVVMLTGFGLTAMAQDNTGRREGQHDQQVSMQVADELQKKDRFRGITAKVDDGIVTLSGKVGLYIDKVNAEKCARKVKNVDGVRNHLEVEGKEIADAELRETLANKLRYDRIGYGIVFNSLTVAVDSGTVTVEGKVRDYPDRDSAIAIVETTPGVRDLVDEIDVAPVSNFDDNLRLRLARAIYGQASLQKYAIDPQAPIRIVVENGNVELSGVVLNEADRQVAYTQARSVSGTFSVKNNLMIASKGSK